MCCAAVAVLATGACGSAPPVAPPEPTTSAEPSAASTSEPGPTASEVAALAPDCASLEPTEVAVVDGPLADDPVIAAAQQARAEHALPSDIATVERIVAEHPGPYRLGYPHTDAEFDDVVARNAASEIIDEIRTWAASEGLTPPAGVWIDHAAGGIATLALTDDVEAYEQHVSERYPDQATIVEAVNSAAELEAVRSGLGHLIGERGDPRTPPAGMIVGHGTSDQLNRVRVQVLGDPTSLRADLTERFGAGLLCLDVTPIPTAEDAQPAAWEPVPGVELTPDTTTLQVVVQEFACSGGSDPTDRITDPEIRYEPDAVVVTIRVIPRAGPQDCPGNPRTPYTLQLAEPLGGRQLLDGGTSPPSPPDIGRPPRSAAGG